MSKTTRPTKDNATKEASSSARSSNPTKTSKTAKASEKLHQPTEVHGHTMPYATIFKFAGLIIFLAIMVVAVVLIWPFVHEIFEPDGLEKVTTEVRNAGSAGFLIILAIQILQVIVAFIPGEAVQIAAGMIYGPLIGGLIILVGCIISSTLIFLLVHKLGAPFVHAMVPESALEKFRSFEKGRKLNALVFILFLIPGLPKDVFTYLTPLTDMSLKSFVILSNTARIPGILLSTYAASGLVEGDFLTSAIIFAATAVVAIAGLVIYQKVGAKLDEKGHTHKHTLNKLDEN